MKLEVAPTVFHAADQTPEGAAAFGMRRFAGAMLLLLIALLAIAIDGYHPYSEDAGIYVAGIKQAADPGLYGASAVFVTASSHLSRFCALNAMVARSHSLSLDSQLLGLQILTAWLLLYGCWRLATLCFPRNEARWASVLLVAVCLSVPIAGSSLFMMDPYVTGRSFSTPFTLLAIAACLDGRMLRSALLLLLVALFHPLMAIYATGFVLVLWAVRQRSPAGVAVLMASALAAGAAIRLSQRAVAESDAYRAAVETRPYFFLEYWRWFELFGLAAPVALLALYAWWQRSTAAEHATRERFNVETPRDRGIFLAQASAAVGVAAVAVSATFVRPEAHSHLLAAMQPIRAFVPVYFCLFLLLGGVLGEFVLQSAIWRWGLLFGCLGAALAIVQHRQYPALPHLDLPFASNSNDWDRAFLWIKSNTPRDAVFALDADYIHAPGEDAQGFRAIAERGALADSSKDGGAAAVFPQLAEKWGREHVAQTGLNEIEDGERLRRLAPIGVTWIVLDEHSPTMLVCPFENATAKVCRLR